MQPTQGLQWELATSLNGVCPYSRWTGSSGQMLEHQPLLPFSIMPPAKPPTRAPSSSSALAGPESSRPIFRSEMKRMNIDAAMTKPYSLSHFGAVSAAREVEHARRLVRRGQRADVAPQPRRHEPDERQHGDDELPQDEEPVVGDDHERHGEPDGAEQRDDADRLPGPTGRRLGICV